MIEAAGLAIAPNTAVRGPARHAPALGRAARPVDVPAATGALMMVRREEFLDLGGFYEPFFMYGEEADYCLRVPGRDRPAPGQRDPARVRPCFRAAAVGDPALLGRPQPPDQRGPAPAAGVAR